MASADRASHPIRIFVLNDHEDYMRALERFLDKEADLQVIGTGHAAPLQLEPVLAARPDVVIIDPEIHDLEIGLMVRELSACAPGSRIIVLTMNDDARFKEAALAAGADDFIFKMDALDQLVPAIRRGPR